MQNLSSSSPPLTPSPSPLKGARGAEIKDTSMKREFFWLSLLALVCLAIVCMIDFRYRSPDAGPWETLFPRILAVATCFCAAAAGLLFSRSDFTRRYPIAAILMGIQIRLGILVGAIAFVTATKWNNHNLFTNTLVGCYFSFLALESCLTIQRIKTQHIGSRT